MVVDTMELRHIRELPEALDGVHGYPDVEPKYKRRLRGSMWRIDQICWEAQHQLDNSVDEVFYVLDSLESDALVLLGASQHPEITSWFIHSQWTSEFSSKLLQSSLSELIKHALDMKTPVLDSDWASIHQWAQIQVSALRESIEAFYNASTAEIALAHKLSIDIILGHLAVSAMKMRFTKRS
jgi:hypothetical protein